MLNLLEQPKDFPFEILGYFEEIMECDGYHFIGARDLKEKPDQPLGGAGVKRLFKRGEVVILNKGPKGQVPFKFKRDTECWVTTQALCGRMTPRVLQNAREDMLK
jgi:hypothetical protein